MRTRPEHLFHVTWVLAAATLYGCAGEVTLPPERTMPDASQDVGVQDAGAVDLGAQDAREPAPDVPDEQDLGSPEPDVSGEDVGGVTCDRGPSYVESCNADGNDVVWRCTADGTYVVDSTTYGCTTTSNPGIGTRVCPGELFTRSCWPIAGGHARVSWRCEGAVSQDDVGFVEVDHDYCTASSGPEAGQHFCPGEVILRDQCPAGARQYYMCPEDADTGSTFALEESVACGEANAWEPLHRGVELRRWVQNGHRMRALRIDLCDTSLRMKTTETNDRRQRTSAWASAQPKMIAAVNGGFFPPGNPGRPDGVAYGGGVEWPDSQNTQARGFLAFGERNVWYSEVAFDGPADTLTPWIEEGVSHDFVMIRAGQAQTTSSTTRRARTGAGFTQDQRTYYFLTVDEVGGSAGMSVNEFAQAFADTFPDAWSAVRLDGGGSTAIWSHEHGLLNNPSDGSERTVANHVGVYIEGGLRGYNCP